MGNVGRESVDTKGLVSLTSDASSEIWKIKGVIQRSEEEHSGQREQQSPGCNQRGRCEGQKGRVVGAQ